MNASTKKNKRLYNTVLQSRSGGDSVIVFLHGLGSSQNFYYSIAKKLSSKYTCVLLDNEGSGRTPLTNADMSIETVSQGIIDLLSELGFSQRPLTFVGHSMSGMTVNYINSQFKDKLNIRQNILLGPVHPSPTISDIFNKRIETIKKTNSLFEIANAVLETAIGTKCSDQKKAFIRELISAQSIEGYIANCAVIAKAGYQTDSFLEYYKNNTTRTLIIVGEEDKTAPWTGCVEIICQNLENNKVHTLEGVGHWHAIEEDKKVFQAIQSFIE